MKNNATAMGVRTRIIYSALAITAIILSTGEERLSVLYSEPFDPTRRKPPASVKRGRWACPATRTG